jgi:sec-independent protein translocase protein TatA
MVGLESPWHIAILALVLLVAFGPKRLPEIGRSVGRGMREFRRSVSCSDDEPAPPTLCAGTTTSPSRTSAEQKASRRERDAILQVRGHCRGHSPTKPVTSSEISACGVWAGEALADRWRLQVPPGCS